MSQVFKSKEMRRDCSLSGVGFKEDQLHEMVKIADGLRVTLNGLSSERGWATFHDGALAGLKWTKASCDAFISIAATWGPPQAKAIEGMYVAGSGVGEAASKKAAGQRVNTSDVAKSVIEGVAKGVPGTKYGRYMMGKDADKNVKQVSGIAVINTKLIHGAINGNESSVKKAVFLDLSAEIVKITFEGAGMNLSKKAVGTAKSVADLGFSVAATLEEYKSASSSTKNSFDMQEKMIRSSLSRIEITVRRLSAELNECALQRLP